MPACPDLTAILASSSIAGALPINDDEAEDMVRFCIEHDFTLRFIETMPMGDTGRQASDRYVNLTEIKNRLAEKFDLILTEGVSFVSDQIDITTQIVEMLKQQAESGESAQ